MAEKSRDEITWRWQCALFFPAALSTFFYGWGWLGFANLVSLERRALLTLILTSVLFGSSFVSSCLFVLILLSAVGLISEPYVRAVAVRKSVIASIWFAVAVLSYLSIRYP
jgi:hypothetical protein